MTHSRYDKSVYFDGVIWMTHADWYNFYQDTRFSCTFKQKKIGNHDLRVSFEMCRFSARYYQDDEYVYFHVTNDTRREIQRYINSKKSIYDCARKDGKSAGDKDFKIDFT
jgi:hypothetical protein